jgi:di/tricarboxylate transporter
MHPIQAGNIVLIFIGVLLVVSGPYIVYRTVVGVLQRRKEDPKASLHLASNGLNFLIAVLFFLAGILFIVNNLRGNPLG